MIDWKQENVVSLMAATKHVPKRNGKRPAFTTLLRWAKRGLRGVRLETVRVGGTICTSLEALDRFFDRLSEPEDRTVLPSDRQRAQQAAKRLEKAGFK